MNKSAALLWDESFLWGLMLMRALRHCGLAYTIITAEDIKSGALGDYSALIVPGGWASNKLKALGDEGANTIRHFVSSGRAYFGICGGAGLATKTGLGLMNISRRPLKERTPSLSGPVMLTLCAHPIWEGIAEPRLHIWWPSQFLPGDDSIKVLGRFESHTPETFSSDFCAGDMEEEGWERIERAYGINLDPSRMKGDPLVVEGAYGKGRVILSLIHPDTPGDPNGARMLLNIWRELGLDTCPPVHESNSPVTSSLLEHAEGLYDFGRRNFLWYDRPALIQWRRGIRGTEYYTLIEMIRALSAMDISVPSGLTNEVGEFTQKAKQLLLHERMALQRGESLSFASTEDDTIRALRSELFSERKSYGGRFKIILDKLDKLLLEGLRKKC